ncbi:PAS domain S-box protein [Herbaspirillum sp. NPDC101396]|uniref:sensor domain-containing protein n=1 Tax=Herbaspirillum sp. NPDC101396 TaxID=3364005 RepID=UPI00383B11C9
MKNHPEEEATGGRRIDFSDAPFETAARHDPATCSAKAYFEGIIQSCDDAIISKTLDGIVTSWNPGAETIFGYTESEMLGQPLLRLFPNDRINEEALILEKIINGERVTHFETIRIRKNGLPIKVSVTISPIRDGQGRIVGASKIARDITAQSHLETTAEQFHALVTSSDDAIISKTLDGKVTSWNTAAQAMFGYSAEEMLGEPMLKLFPQDRQDEELFILEKMLAGEKIDHFDTVRLHKDGSPIHVSVTISPIRDKHGTIIGASKIARDITLRKIAEANFKLTSSVFTHTSEGIAITDSHGVIVEVNQALTCITGYAREELVGRTSSVFRSSRQGPDVEKAVLANLLQSGHARTEIWSRRKDGESYTGLLTISAVTDESGKTHKYIALFTDITSLRKQQEKLEHVTNFDMLTDLPNRLLLSDRLRQAMHMSKRSGKDLAVLYLDLDGFKLVNDEHGHEVGDALLIALSQRMLSVLRDIDTLARMGGDEFVAVLVDVGGRQELDSLAGKILKACSDPIVIGNHVIQVSASIGATLFPDDDVDEDQLIRHADFAMYEAKQSGKNRYHIFDAARDAEEKGRGAQLRRLAQALEHGEFVLYYQPKVNMKTGAVTGAEALIRWQHPELGLVPPASFLPLIEGHRLSDDIGTWVIGTALAQMSTWKKMGLTLAVSVNLGPRQLQQENFYLVLCDMLARHPDVAPENLELEILETSALQNIDAVSQVMRVCRDLGVHFSIDDFGTGYSSLTYLKRLPAETLKIDQSFVRDMLSDQEDLAIVRGVIGLADAFHRNVIAEGVETIAHGEELLRIGCEQAQGYGISRPMLASMLPEWLASWRSPQEWKSVC